MKIKKRQAGFTLIELLIGMSIITILLASAFGILSNSLLSWKKGSDHTALQQSTRMALDSLVREIRYSRAIVTPAASGTSAALAVKVLASDGIHEDTITYQLGTRTGLNPNTLYRIEDKWSGTSDAKPITENNVSNLAFAVTLPRHVGISITLLNPSGLSLQLDTSVAAMNIKGP